MTNVAFVSFYARILRHPPFIEVTIGSDDEVKLEVVDSRCSNVQDVQDPFRFTRIPLRRVYFRSEAAFRMDIVLPGQRLPIFLDLVALGVLLRPVNLGRVCRLVAVRRDVAPDTGIGVLNPSATLGFSQ